MRKRLIIFIPLLLCLLLSAGCTREDKIAGTIQIGVYEPETGKDSLGGNQEILGIRYANSLTPTVEINEKLYKIDLVIADNQSDAEMGITAAESLIEEKVSVVLGSYGSQMTEFASELFGEAGIPILGITCTNTEISDKKNHYFRICYTDVFQAQALAGYLREQNLRSVFCISQEGNDDSIRQAETFAEAFQELGGEAVRVQIPAEEGKQAEALNSCMETLAQEKCDAVFAPVSFDMAKDLLQQAEKAAVSVPVYGGLDWDSHGIASLLEGKNTEVLVCTLFQEGSDPDFERGLQEWIAADEMNLAANGGADGLSAGAALGYDAYYTALEAIKLAGTADAEEISRVLPEVVYDGVCGKISFDEKGDAERTVLWIKKGNSSAGIWETETERTA